MTHHTSHHKAPSRSTRLRKLLRREIVMVRHVFRKLIMTIVILSILWWVVVFWYLYHFVITNPQFSIYDLPLAVPSKILDVQWRELYTVFEERRNPVSYDAIAPVMIDALISAEDKDFWVNDGFDPKGIARSTLVTLRDRYDNGFLWYSQWASTLTQQIIKNRVVWKEKKFSRKINEIIHAWLLTYNTFGENKKMFVGDERADIWQRSKQDIVTYYFNSTFFGNHAYGVAEAARIYFGTTPDQLTVPQSAVLASIPKSPYFFDPYRYPEHVAGRWEMSIDYGLPTAVDGVLYGTLLRDVATKINYPDNRSGQNILTLLPQFEGKTTDEDGVYRTRSIRYRPGRKDYVINRLYQDNQLSVSDAVQAVLDPLIFAPKPEYINTIRAPHFVNYVRDAIINNPSFGINEQQLAQWWYTIHTTLDLSVQEWLEEMINTYRDSAAELWAYNRSVLVTDMRHGAILWYVWSYDFYDTSIQWQVDMIRNRRQTWSTLKPLIYAYGMMQYPLWLDTKIRDKKTNFNWYIPNNADGAFKWNIRLKNALAWSRNIPAIKIFNAMGGTQRFVPWFTDMGMQGLSLSGNYGLSMALGTVPMSMIDLAQWYTHLSDGEDAGMIHGIAKIEDYHGFTIFEHGEFSYVRQIPLWVARLITYILETPLFAPGYFRSTTQVPSCPSCASKTGTTNMRHQWRSVPRDGRLVTYNPDVIVTMRAGNTDASPLNPKAYGYRLNTDLRNDIFDYLVQKELTSDTKYRSYPEWVTRHYRGHGEWYADPVHTSIPQSVRNRL